MKEITSKRSGKIQIISDEVWNWLVAQGWHKRYACKEVPVVELKKVPIIPPEIQKISKQKRNGQNN